MTKRKLTTSASNTDNCKRRIKVALVNREFPSLTKTFHYNEYRGLTRSDFLEVNAYAVKRPSQHSPEADDVMKQTTYLPQLVSWLTFVSLVRTILRHPIRVSVSLVGCVVHARWGNKEGGRIGAAVFGLRGVQLADVLTLDRDGPDIIHSQFATDSATIALVASRILNCPFSFAVHSPYTLYRNTNLLTHKVNAASFVTVISRFARRKLSKLCNGKASTKLHVVHCGVEIAQLASLREASTMDDRILSVGSLIELKGHQHLVAACNTMRERGVHFRCDIVGEGPYRVTLTEMIHSLKLEGYVFLHGAQPAQVVRRMLGWARVFVLASCTSHDGDLDGIPVVLMEAMGAGVACVSTRVSGIPELISSPDEGILVEEKDPEALADAIETLLGDEAMRERMARAGRAKVEREFDINKSAARLAELFRESMEVDHATNAKTRARASRRVPT